MMRRASSPRLAISIFLNITIPAPSRATNHRGSENTESDFHGIENLTSVPLCLCGLSGVNNASKSFRFDGEQPLAILHGLAVLHIDSDDLAVAFGVDLVHELHRLDDAEHLPLLDSLAYVHERLGAR